ncbi:MAG: hypothetical protein HEP71_32730 [Roseivirga sp.]|nr:hypothetical protein [Roseivirga sp.]
MRISLILIFLTSVFCARAQNNIEDLDIAFGPMFSVSKRSVPTQFVGSDAESFYVVYSRGKTGTGRRYLHKFGFDLKLEQEARLSTRLGSIDTESEAVLMLDGKIFQIMHASYGNKRNFYVQPIEREGLKLGQEQLIGTFTSQGRGLGQSKTFINATRDSSYVSVIYTIPGKRKENEQFAVNIFNKKMEKVWSQQYEFPYENRLIDLQEFRVDGNGDLYALAKRNFENRRDRVDGLVNYDYLLFNLKREGGIDSLKINTEGKFLRDMKVEFTPEGDIVSAGFYSNLNASDAGGAFYMRLDGKTKEVVSSSFKEFELDFVLQNLTERKAKRVEKRIKQGRNRELPYYHIDELVAMPDGSVRMIGEQRLIYTTTMGYGVSTVTQTHYLYNDMVIVSINKDGEVEWAERIAKRQHTIDDRAAYSSYALMKRDNELAFMFNDNAQNLDYNGVGRVAPMAKNSSTVVMAARVGQFGDVRRAGLFRRGEAEIKIRPVFAHQLDEDELLLFGHRQLREQRFVIVKFK